MQILRPLYNWTLRQAEKPYATALLMLVAFMEPCLFPMPPDLLLIPIALADRPRALRAAAFATLGSVLGAIVGYSIGALFMKTVGNMIVSTYHLESAFQHFHHAFHQWGVWIILGKGLTPIPFILVTIASGVAQLNLAVFIVSCAITRGARFFFEAWLIRRFGTPVQHFIERHLTWVALAVLAAILFGFWIVLH
jgi:membrane protein YqaA with SNARE-associated domain